MSRDAFCPGVPSGADTVFPSDAAKPRTVFGSFVALQHGEKKFALIAACNPYFSRKALVVDATVFRLPWWGVV